MQLENEAHDLERIAKAFRLISKEISYGGLTNALLPVAIEKSGAVRGIVLLSEGGELLAKANASLPREEAQAIATHPPDSEFRLPADPRLGRAQSREHATGRPTAKRQLAVATLIYRVTWNLTGRGG